MEIARHQILAILCHPARPLEQHLSQTATLWFLTYIIDRNYNLHYCSLPIEIKNSFLCIKVQFQVKIQRHWNELTWIDWTAANHGVIQVQTVVVVIWTDAVAHCVKQLPQPWEEDSSPVDHLVTNTVPMAAKTSLHLSWFFLLMVGVTRGEFLVCRWSFFTSRLNSNPTGQIS